MIVTIKRLQMEVKHGRVIAVHALAGLSSKQSLDLNNVLKGTMPAQLALRS